jgi:hypothetical protein
MLIFICLFCWVIGLFTGLILDRFYCVFQVIEVNYLFVVFVGWWYVVALIGCCVCWLVVCGGVNWLLVVGCWLLVVGKRYRVQQNSCTQ